MNAYLSGMSSSSATRSTCQSSPRPSATWPKSLDGRWRVPIFRGAVEEHRRPPLLRPGRSARNRNTAGAEVHQFTEQPSAGTDESRIHGEDETVASPVHLIREMSVRCPRGGGWHRRPRGGTDIEASSPELVGERNVPREVAQDRGAAQASLASSRMSLRVYCSSSGGTNAIMTRCALAWSVSLRAKCSAREMRRPESGHVLHWS